MVASLPSWLATAPNFRLAGNVPNLDDIPPQSPCSKAIVVPASCLHSRAASVHVVAAQFCTPGPHDIIARHLITALSLSLFLWTALSNSC